MRKLFILVLLSFVFFCGTGYAATYYVDAVNGNNSNDGTTELTAWRTITKAVAPPVASGDQIIVLPGTYNSPDETFPITLGAGVSLESKDLLGAIIDAGSSSSNVIEMGNNSKIQGFLIQTSGSGTGIYVDTGIDGVIITQNRIIADTGIEFKNNSYNATISYNDIISSSAKGNYGIIANNFGIADIIFNKIGPAFTFGAWFQPLTGDLNIINNTFVMNDTGLRIGPHKYIVVCKNNIFYGSKTAILIKPAPQQEFVATYCSFYGNGEDVDGGVAGEGCIYVDPLFVDPEGGNYYLTFDSPCIDAGTPEGTDIGCYSIWDGLPPLVQVISPNGGETWQAGSIYNITWTATQPAAPVQSINIYYSVDGGTSYPYTIVTGTTNDSPYSWTVTNTPTDQAKVKVEAVSSVGVVGTDESDAVFTISAAPNGWIGQPPSVEVISPNGGETWQVGSTYDITWTATQPAQPVQSINIYYSIDGGITYPYLIASGEANDYTYSWTVTNTPTTQAKVKVEAISSVGIAGTDESDAVFTISATADGWVGKPPLVNVISPNGGENWQVGTAYNISWEATQPVEPVQSINIYYSINGGITYPYLIVSGTSNDGTHSWTVTNTPTTQAKVKVEAVSSVGITGSDESDAVFTIWVTGEVVPGPSLSGISLPTYTNVQTIPVTAQGVTGSPTQMMISEDPNFSGASWVPYANPTTFMLSTGDGTKTVYYKLKDASDIESNIVSGTTMLDQTPPSIDIQSPNGGENWLSGTNQEIKWLASDSGSGIKPNSINIYYSTDGGQSYPNTITVGAPNNGTFSWAVPNLDENDVKIKITVSDNAGNQGEDVSSGNFEIKKSPAGDAGPPRIIGGIITHPRPYSPSKDGTFKIIYNLNKNTDVTIYIYGAREIVWKTEISAGVNGGKIDYNDPEMDLRGMNLGDGIYVIYLYAKDIKLGTGHLVVFE